MTKPGLQKTGLMLMLLGLIIAVFYVVIGVPLLYTSPVNFRFSIVTFCEAVLPAIVVTAIAWKDRVMGGFIAAVLGAIALSFCTFLSFSTVDTKPDFFWFTITICFLLGGASILTSLGIHTMRKERPIA
ncbi:MAG: hypothetical protein ACYDG5_00360 [Dehalococcoidales bacterium]